MCQGTLNLLTYVLPAVPLLPWVLTLPFAAQPDRRRGAHLRRLGHGLVQTPVGPGCARGARRRGYRHPALKLGHETQSVPTCHRRRRSLRPRPRWHAELSPLPRLGTDEVGDVLQVARVRILRYLARRGVLRRLPATLEINDEPAARDPVLAELAAAAVSGLPVPSGPSAADPRGFPAPVAAGSGASRGLGATSEVAFGSLLPIGESMGVVERPGPIDTVRRWGLGDCSRGVSLSWCSPDDAVSTTRDGLPHHAPVGIPSVQILSAVPRFGWFGWRRSCGRWFGCLRGQAHGGQDLLDGVVVLDQGDEAQRSPAARADGVDLEGSPEQLAPRDVVRERQGARGFVFLL
jgi:hypothetical protein